MLHITRRRDATSNALQLRPGPQLYNNSKQQNKRYKATNTATTTLSSFPPQAPTEHQRQRAGAVVPRSLANKGLLGHTPPSAPPPPVDQAAVAPVWRYGCLGGKG